MSFGNILNYANGDIVRKNPSGILRRCYVAFTLLIVASPHMVTMLNELNNLPRLDVILNGKPIGLKNCVSWQHDGNIGKISSRGGNRS
jgi:hypothetical protein